MDTPATRYFVLYETIDGPTLANRNFPSWQEARAFAAGLSPDAQVLATLGNRPLGGVHHRFLQEVEQFAPIAARVTADENESEDAQLVAATLLNLYHNLRGSSRMGMPAVQLKSDAGMVEVTGD